MEMDRFVQDLRGQATEEIVRWDTQSTITMQVELAYIQKKKTVVRIRTLDNVNGTHEVSLI